MTQDAHGHGHGNHGEPEIVTELKNGDEFLKRIQKSYNQIHSRAHTHALDKLVEEGLIEMKDGDYDFDALKKSDVRKKLKEYMLEHFDQNMKKRLGDIWDTFNKRWKDFYMESVLGITGDTLEQHLNSYQGDYNVDLHLRAQEEALKHIMQKHQQIHIGMVKGEHAKDVFKHYLKLPEDEMAKIEWDMLEKNSLYIRSAIHEHMSHNKFTDPYLRQQPWYKSGDAHEEGHDAHAHGGGHGHGGH